MDVMRRYGVVPEAWAPLGSGRYNPFEEPDFVAIAAAHGKTVGQVLLRWNIQRGVVVTPKSTHAGRIRENFDVWDFGLTSEEMSAISSHDMGYSGSRAKHFGPSFVRMVLGKEWLEGDTIPRKMPEVTLPSRTTWTLRVISGACDFR